MLNERSQIQKATCYIISFKFNIQNRQIYQEKVDQWLPRAGQEEKGIEDWVVKAKECKNFSTG